MANSRPTHARPTSSTTGHAAHRSTVPANVYGFDAATYREVFVEIDELAARALLDAEMLIADLAGRRAVDELRAPFRKVAP